MLLFNTSLYLLCNDESSRSIISDVNSGGVGGQFNLIGSARGKELQVNISSSATGDDFQMNRNSEERFVIDSAGSVTLNRQLITTFSSFSYSATIAANFTSGNWKTIDLTGDATINVTNLPEGVSTLVINQDGTGRTITIGTGWGTAVDNNATLSATASAKNIVQFIYDGTDISYVTNTVGN